MLRLSIRYEYEMMSVIALTNLLDNTNCWQMRNASASSFKFRVIGQKELVKMLATLEISMCGVVTFK